MVKKIMIDGKPVIVMIIEEARKLTLGKPKEHDRIETDTFLEVTKKSN